MLANQNRDILFLKLLKKISDNCRAQRIKRGWTPFDLAIHAETSKQTIYDLESGTGNITLRTLINIAHALELDILVLIS